MSRNEVRDLTPRNDEYYILFLLKRQNFLEQFFQWAIGRKTSRFSVSASAQTLGPGCHIHIIMRGAETAFVFSLGRFFEDEASTFVVQVIQKISQAFGFTF